MNPKTYAVLFTLMVVLMLATSAFSGEASLSSQAEAVSQATFYVH